MSWHDMRALLDMEHELLSSADRHLLLALRVRVGDNGKCWPSQKRICRDTGLSERTVRSSTAKLERLGLIKAAKDENNGRQKVYEITGIERRSCSRGAAKVGDRDANTGKSPGETGMDRRRIPAATADRMNQRKEKEGNRVAARSRGYERVAVPTKERNCQAAQIGELINLLSKRRP